MNATALLAEIISILTGGIVGIGEGVGAGLSALATSIFLTGTGETQTLSTFGVITIIFAAVSLGIGLCRLIVRWISTLGGSRV